MSSQAFDLSGKTAVVTGARRGIGHAIAIALAQHGADIIGVSSGIDDASEVATAVRALGRSFEGIRCDLADHDQVSVLARQLAGRHVDILINNAGVTQRTPILDHTDQMWNRVMQVNLNAPFALAREVGRQMVERQSGKIIFLGSLWSFQGGLNVVGYTTSKHGIAGMTKAFSNEWSPHGVNVNAIAPGFIETDMNSNLSTEFPERYAFIMSRIPRKEWGGTDDVANAAVYLASPASDYVHGSILTVDGGWLAG